MVAIGRSNKLGICLMPTKRYIVYLYLFGVFIEYRYTQIYMCIYIHMHMIISSIYTPELKGHK